MAEPVLGKLLQVCVVVRDMQRALEHYWEKMGIGPWRVYTFEPPDLVDTRVRGQDVAYTMKLALAFDADGMMYELVEPLEGPSIYKDFLAEHGEGIHHVACANLGGLDNTIEQFAARGMSIAMEGTWKGIHYVYFESEQFVATTFETWHWPEGMELPEPEYWYPAQ